MASFGYFSTSKSNARPGRGNPPHLHGEKNHAATLPQKQIRPAATNKFVLFFAVRLGGVLKINKIIHIPRNGKPFLQLWRHIFLTGPAGCAVLIVGLHNATLLFIKNRPAWRRKNRFPQYMRKIVV